MELTSVTKTDPFAKLKCDSCKNCLSVFPIYISEDKKNICGRCPEELLEKFVKNEVYEALAEFILFPCRYQDQGCGTKAVPEDMTSHEKVCEFRAVKCPIEDCNWEEARTTLLLHCQGKHSNLVLQNGEFELDMNQSYQRENFMEHDSAMFIVKQKFYTINKLMEFSISNLETEVDTKVISCEVSFKTANRGLAVKYWIKASDDSSEEVNLDALKDRNSSVVKGKINFEKKSAENVQPEAEKVDRDLLSHFKCVNCGKYCLPPFNFQKDNSMSCIDCRPAVWNQNGYSPTCSHLNNSPTIKTTSASPKSSLFKSPAPSPSIFPNSSDTGDGRKCLNGIAYMQNYPCKYEESGCTFISKPFQMQTHLTVCPYRKYNCPLAGDIYNCPWGGTGRDMVAHVFASHDSMILKSSTISITCPRVDGTITAPSFTKCHILQQLNHLFRLSFVKDKECYRWQMQMIGPFKSGFMFELEIMDRNNLGRSLVSKHPCKSLSDNSGNVCFYNDQVNTFITSDQTITFKVQIFKL